MIIWLYILVMNILLALADGLFHIGKKPVSKLVELCGLMLLFYIGSINTYPLHLIFFVVMFLRLGVFNLTFNIVTKNKLTYVGNTDIFDKIIKFIPESLRLLIYIMSICFSFGLIWNYNG